MIKQTVGNALEKFSIDGWPSDLEGIKMIIKPLAAIYGDAKITSERYPDWGPSILIDGKAANFSQTEGWSTNPQLFIHTGMRWSLEFPNGQTIAVVISIDGSLLERTYKDQGDIHINEVVKFLRGWQKSIKQAQRGGRKPDPEMIAAFDEWHANNFNPKYKGQLRKEYVKKHPDEELYFNDSMKNLKRKYRRGKYRV